MAVSIQSDDGNVKIRVDGKSSVRGIRVGDSLIVNNRGNVVGINGKYFGTNLDGRRFWDKPLGVFTAAVLMAIGIVLVFVALSATARSCEGTAQGAQCDILKHADDRHFCRALTYCLKSECEFIDAGEKRQECRIRESAACDRDE